MPGVTFRNLTSQPGGAGVPAPSPQPPLPDLNEPTALPVAPSSQLGRLRPVAEHPRVLDLAAYHHAGIPSAPPRSLVRPEVAGRLAHAATILPRGFGLAVFDAWRPLTVQQHLHHAAYNPARSDTGLPVAPGFVTPPSADPRTPPPHLTGGTVDVTLTWQGLPLALGTDFDDFTPRAHADALEGEPGPARELRRLLYWTMRRQGFVVIACEWWHYEYGTPRWAALTGNRVLFGATQPTGGAG